MKEHEERVYIVSVDLVSSEPEELVLQLETLMQEISEGTTYKKEKVNGLAQGQCELTNFIRCKYCHGDGEVATDEDDGEGHIMRGVGREKCICRI